MKFLLNDKVVNLDINLDQHFEDVSCDIEIAVSKLVGHDVEIVDGDNDIHEYLLRGSDTKHTLVLITE